MEDENNNFDRQRRSNDLDSNSKTPYFAHVNERSNKLSNTKSTGGERGAYKCHRMSTQSQTSTEESQDYSKRLTRNGALISSKKSTQIFLG